jgi:predicted MFS family arabinose efflux permease
VGGALASPAVLALVVTSFPEGRERTRALGIYMGVITGGSSLGLVLGGVITEWLSWRWVLFINVPIGVAVLVITPLFVGETRVRQPITPLRLFTDVSRAGSFLARLLLIAGMFGVFFFLTQFLRKVMGFSPLRAGVAFLPMTIALFAVSRLAPRLMPRVGTKPLMIVGMLPAVASMAWLWRILGPMLLLGLGMGLVFVPLTTTSLAGVPAADSGLPRAC